MRRFVKKDALAAVVLTLVVVAGCARGTEPLAPAETFTWVAQPIAFSPPSGPWERQGDNGGGMLGVRFILTGGGGQCISVYGYRQLAERDRRDALEKLISGRDSLSRREFLSELSLARARTEDPVSEREAATARDINAALDQAMTDYLSEPQGFVLNDLNAALRAASSYEATLAELLPHIRLRPERMQEPERWRIGYERDTTLSGISAFASDDTLVTPERPLLYREIFWVVKGCAFKAVYQGTPENVATFNRVVDSIRFQRARVFRLGKAAAGLALAIIFACEPGCSSPKSRIIGAEVGHHRAQLEVPEGWERLDHGRQQLFRSGENQISLVDLGPATRDAMVDELRATEGLWREGRRKDAFQRIRELRGPVLQFAPSEQRSDYWKQWTDVTYIPDLAESSAVGRAFEAMIARAAMFPEVTPERMLEYVLGRASDTQRKEVGRQDRRTIHGSDWIDVELWDRVSHLDRSRVAFLVDNGYLLVLATDRGVFDQTGPGFEALLTSIDVTADAPEAR